MLSTQHERKKSGFWNTAAVFTADIDEVWSTFVSPIHIIHPESLLVRPVILEVEMIDHIVEGTFNEITNVYDW